MAEDTASTAAAEKTATAATTDAASTTQTTDKTATTTTDAAAAAKAAGTVLDDKAAADTAAAAKPGAWPEDWRARAAKGKDGAVDDKRLQRLTRYASPEAALDALINAQDRIAKGDLAKVLGANPTPEEVAEYRAANGIPAKPEEYKVELPGGRVIGDADKPLVAKFLEGMHKENASPKYVNAALASYYELLDEQTRAREDADVDAKAAIEDTMRQEYGAEYRPNLNAVRGLLEQFPGEAGKMLLSARSSDGSLIFNDPGVFRAFVHLARELNPAATVAPGSTASAGKSVGDELVALRAAMADQESNYHKGPKIEKDGIKDTVQAHRYRELLAAQERLEARRAA